MRSAADASRVACKTKWPDVQGADEKQRIREPCDLRRSRAPTNRAARRSKPMTPAESKVERMQIERFIIEQSSSAIETSLLSCLFPSVAYSWRSSSSAVDWQGPCIDLRAFQLNPREVDRALP